MAEPRREHRLRALKRARVYVGDDDPGTDCMVRSLSASGARIEFSDAVALSEGQRIVVLFAAETVRFQAHVVWCSERAAGIAFARPLSWLAKYR